MRRGCSRSGRRERRVWSEVGILWASVDAKETLMTCDCCDPTSDSPDPVVTRLEREVERLNFDLCQCRNELTTAREISHRLGTERDALQAAVNQLKSTPEHYLRGVVNVLASKLAYYTGKTVPTEVVGADSVLDELTNKVGELERLKEACWIFRTYGLAPSDVSGRAEWDRALLLLVGGEA
jgi:hypothetical protein